MTQLSAESLGILAFALFSALTKNFTQLDKFHPIPSEYARIDTENQQRESLNWGDSSPRYKKSPRMTLPEGANVALRMLKYPKVNAKTSKINHLMA